MPQHLDLAGVNRLVDLMRGRDRRLRAAVYDVMKTGAVNVQRDAKILVPVDIGNLRSSITRRTRPASQAVEFEVRARADYSRYVEEGTSTVAPQPYMRPALRRNTRSITSALRQAGKDALR